MKYDRRFKRQNNFIWIKLHNVINILHYICISQNYRYGIERFRVILERFIKDLTLELDRLIRAEFEVGLIN